MQPLFRTLLVSSLLLTATVARAQSGQRAGAALNEQALKRFDALTQHLGPELSRDPALKADFQSVANDKPPAGLPHTATAYEKYLAQQHPKLTAALAADGWKPGEFYQVLATMVGSYNGMKDYNPQKKPANSFERNVAFVAAHQGEVKAALERLPQGNH